MHIHILGICGTFMAGIAALARECGHQVTGSDENPYPPMSEQLRSIGIQVLEGYGADQIALRADLWVIGNVIRRGNPLLEEILDSGAPYSSGPAWLSEQVLRGKWVLAVAGTHGKTTTSSMLAWILEANGKAPGFLIGGLPKNFDTSARLGRSRFFVVEADEYDTAFFDKRSKFVHFRPRTAVLTSLEFDHADIFRDLGDIERQFHHLVRTVPRSGLICFNSGDEALRRVLEMGCWSNLQSFGPGGAWTCSEPETDGAASVTFQGRTVARLRLPQPGRHNRLNALAGIAASVYAGIEPGAAADALAAYAGVRRRLDLRGGGGGVSVYDDFAHHPTAVRASLDALREQAPEGRILAVLEPRSNTMRLGLWKAELPLSLASADRVYLYAKGLPWDLRAAFAGSSCSLAGIEDDIDRLAELVAFEARPGDRVLVMSNGDFGGLADKLVSLLESRSGAQPQTAGRRR